MGVLLELIRDIISGRADLCESWGRVSSSSARPGENWNGFTSAKPRCGEGNDPSFCFRVFRGSLQFLKQKCRKELNNHGKHRIHGNENGERKSFTAFPLWAALAGMSVTATALPETERREPRDGTAEEILNATNSVKEQMAALTK